MKNKSLLFIMVILLFSTINAQIFQQDFNSSTNLSDYINASNPNTGQWNAISTSGSGTTISVASNNLSFTRTGNAGSFSRTTDFSPTPTGMIYKFDISVSGNTLAQTSAAVLQVGSGFGTANSAESNTSTYARLAINFTSTEGTFQIRDITNSTNSSNLSGVVSITWVLNNTGSSQSYIAPNGNNESVADDKADVWANNTLIFNDITVQTPTQTMTDLKFVFTAGSGTITFDNFLIYGASDNSSLPVQLTSFTAGLYDNKVKLNWSTATEVNNFGFEIERNIVGTKLALSEKGWEKIGFVQGHGNSNSPKDYTFVDANLPAGKVQYRLKQIDYDGTFEYSNIAEVNIDLPNSLVLEQNYPNPFNPETNISYKIPNESFVTLKIYDMLGNEIATLVNEHQKPGTYNAKFRVQNSELSSGVYFYKLQAGNFSQTKKFIVMK